MDRAAAIPVDYPADGDERSLLKREGQARQGARQLHQRIVEAEHDRSDIQQPFLIDHIDEGALVLFFLFA